MGSAVTMAVASLMVVTYAAGQSQFQGRDACKNPPVESRLLSDDARAASPFYVVALPRTAKTAQMDSVCYTYFDAPGPGPGAPFLHVMSTVNNDGSNEIHAFTKGDIADRKGLALATGLDGVCAYHDYTLKPICNSTVFILYRCFIQGECGEGSVDAGRVPGVDVRVALAATPSISAGCRAELQSALANTKQFTGADYTFLPARRPLACVTRYNGTDSIGAARAAGALADDPTDRFGDNAVENKKSGPAPTQPLAVWKNPVAQKGVKPAAGAYGQSQTAVNNGYGSYQPYPSTSNGQQKTQGAQGNTPAPAWGVGHHGGGGVGGHGWGSSFSSWGWQAPQPSQTHSSQEGNVVYHVHRWDTPPPGCCRCY